MKKVFRSAILGPPASGKGTVCVHITKTFNIFHLSMGDILRQNIADETNLGNIVKNYLTKGFLVPDNIVLEIMFEKLKKLSEENFLLDGFPRTVTQAQELTKLYPLHLVINLDVPEEVILRRVENRWVHLPSGRTYNTNFQPPKEAGKDDVTGEPLVQREDDKIEFVKNRLKVYEKEKAPLLNFFKNSGVLQTFKGENFNDLWPSVKLTLEKYMQPKS